MAAKRSRIYHSLSTSLASGIPMDKVLELALPSAGKLKPFLEAWHAAIGTDTSIPGLIEDSGVLTPLEKAMLRSAIRMGGLPEAFAGLSRIFEEVDTNESRFRSAIAMPLIVFHAACFVVPVAGWFNSGAGMGVYLLEVFWLLLYLYIPGVVFLVLYRTRDRATPVHLLFDSLLLRVPTLGRGLESLAYGRFCTVLGASLDAGVEWREAHPAALSVVTLAPIRRKLDVLDKILDGASADEVFGPKVPEPMRLVWETGRKSGQLDKSLKHYGATETEEGFRRLRNFSEWLPKAIYFLMMIFMVLQIFKGFGSIYGVR